MSSYAQDWGTIYNKASAIFTPHARNDQTLKAVVDGTGPMLRLLIECDKNDPRSILPSKMKERAAAVSSLGKLVEQFKKEKARYAALLDSALKVADKQAATEVYRQLKLLRAEIDAVQGRLTSAHTIETKSYEKARDKLSNQIQAQKAKLRKAGVPEMEAKEETYDLVFKQSLLVMRGNLRGSIAQGAAIVQKIKAQPDLATYNAQAANFRNLTQNFSNLIKAQAHAKTRNSKLVKKLPDLQPYEQIMELYGNDGPGNKRRLPVGTDPDDIIKCVKDMNSIVKAMTNVVDQIEQAIK